MLLLLFVSIPIIFVVFIMDIFGLYSRSRYDVTDQPNPKMVTLVNQQIESSVLEYQSNDVFIPEAANNFRKYLKSLKSIQTYSQHGSNSLWGYNRIKADLTHIDGTVEKNTHVSSGGKFRQTHPKLQMLIELKDGKAIKVFTNGLEKNSTPLYAQGSIEDIFKAIRINNFSERRELYYYPPPPKPDPKTEWDKVK